VEHVVYLGLGANLGDRAHNLREGLRLLAPEVEVLAVSDLYETEPVGVLDQPRFLNAVCKGCTKLTPEALLDNVKRVERLVGRVAGERWGPRALDIDVLLYDTAVVDLANLHIPHERLAERAFVLRPLADLDPGLCVPLIEHTVAELLDSVDATGVRRLADSGWSCSEGQSL
jgi:2-amino-4-hydroxy-6-hydroxymethyldihydropteridine diphosphokinase